MSDSQPSPNQRESNGIEPIVEIVEPQTLDAQVLEGDDNNVVDADVIAHPSQPVDAEVHTPHAALPAEVIVTDATRAAPPPIQDDRRQRAESLFGKLRRWVTTFLTWCMGMATLTVTLAGISSIPIVQLISLGYFLEASGRIARSGRFRDGFIGYRSAARFGTVAIGVWLTLIPIRLAANFSHAAFVIDANGAPAIVWRVGITVLTISLAMHAAAAVYCGGRLRDFFWPALIPYSIFSLIWRKEPMDKWFPPLKILAEFRQGKLYSTARERLWSFISQLQIPTFFWLGLRGYVLTLMWIGIPALVMSSTVTGAGAPPPLLFFGGLLMAWVVMYVPLLQAHFAAENDWRAMFQWRAVRQLFARAPIAILISITLTFVLPIPLYLAKIALTSRELTWIANILFVVSLLPSRWVAGWAMSRARRREKPRRAISRWTSRTLIAALAIAYVIITSVFASHLTWEGGGSFFQQHAFLIPGAYFELPTP